MAWVPNIAPRAPSLQLAKGNSESLSLGAVERVLELIPEEELGLTHSRYSGNVAFAAEHRVGGRDVWLVGWGSGVRLGCLSLSSCTRWGLSAPRSHELGDRGKVERSQDPC